MASISVAKKHELHASKSYPTAQMTDIHAYYFHIFLNPNISNGTQKLLSIWQEENVSVANPDPFFFRFLLIALLLFLFQ